MSYENYEEFNEKIRPFYGRGNFSKKCELFKFIEEKENKEAKE